MFRTTASIDPAARGPRRIGLVGLIATLCAIAVALSMTAGPPSWPRAIPSLRDVATTLQGTEPPLEALAYVCTMVAWLLLAWAALSIVLEVLVVLAERLSHGAIWAMRLRRAVTLVTLPVVRRVVDGAMVAVVVANVASRMTPTLSAASLPVQENRLVSMPPTIGTLTPPPVAAVGDTRSAGPMVVEHRVVAGDTLWTIAERYYGSGAAYPRIVDANMGRWMLGGARYVRGSVLQPGWVLVIPGPPAPAPKAPAPAAPAPGTHAEPQVGVYIVRHGDTLWDIAASHLGDPLRWPELFALNWGAELGDGHVLTNPNVIWPGLRLRLAAVPEAPHDEHVVHGDPAAAPKVSLPAPATAHLQPHDGAAPPLTPAVPALLPIALPIATTTPAEAVVDPVLTPVSMSTPAPVEAVTPAPVAAFVPAVAPPQRTEVLAAVGAVGLAGLGVAGAALVVRRRSQRRLGNPPVHHDDDEPVQADGFAQADFARRLVHQREGGAAEPAVLAAEHITRVLAGEGLSDVAVVTSSYFRSTAHAIVRAGLGDHARLLALGPALGARFGVAARVTRTNDHDIQVRLERVHAVRLELAARAHTTTAARLPFFPLGVLGNRQPFFANWRELGHVLVASIPGGGADVVLASLAGALAARRSPRDLRWWTIADRRTLPPGLCRLPHQYGRAIDPTDEDAVQTLLATLRLELDRRIAEPVYADGSERPDLVLLIGEFADLDGARAELEALAADGLAHGIRVLAATTRPEELDAAAVAQFGTRVVLQTLDEAQSVHVLGDPAAADLGAGGAFVLRIDGRAPVEARGFRITDEQFAELVRVMRRPGDGGPGAPDPPGDLVEFQGDGDGDTPTPDVAHILYANGNVPEHEGAGAVAVAAAMETGGTPIVAQAAVLEQVNTPVVVGEQVDHVVQNGHTLVVDPALGDAGEPALATAAHSAPAAAVVAVAPAIDAAADVAAEAALPALPEVDAVVAGVAAAPQAATDAGLIQVRCFGSFLVTCGGHEVVAGIPAGGRSKLWQLLAFLASQPPGPVEQTRICAALWPQVEYPNCVSRFRQTLYRLRELLAGLAPSVVATDTVLTDEKGGCWLNPAIITSDVQRFLAACQEACHAQERAAYERALALYPTDLLCDQSPPLEWVYAREEGISLQDSHRAEYLQIADHLAGLYAAEENLAQAAAIYTSMLELEPSLPDISRSLYWLYQDMGDRDGLVRAHQRLEQRLRNVYSDPENPSAAIDPSLCSPDPETVAAYAAALAELDARPSAGSGPPMPSGDADAAGA